MVIDVLKLCLLALMALYIIGCKAEVGIGVPELLDPTGGEEVLLPVILIWSSVENAEEYTLEVDTTTGFASPVISAEPEDTTYTVIALDTLMYYWRVAAIDEDGDVGVFSDIDSFMVTGPAYPRDLLAAIEVGELPVSLDITPDNNEVWVNNDEQFNQTAYVISTATLEVTHQIPVTGIDCGELRITDNGNYAYFCVGYWQYDEGIIELSTSAYAQTRLISFYDGSSNPVGPHGPGIALTAANDVIYAGHYDFDGALTKFDVSSGAMIDSIGFEWPIDVDLSHAEDKLYAVSEEFDMVYEIDLTDLTIMDSIGVGDDPHYFVITSDDNYAFVSHLNDERIFVIDLFSFTVAATLDLAEYDAYGQDHMGLTPNQNYLFVCNNGGSTIHVVDVSDPLNPLFIETLEFPDYGSFYDICFSSDGSRAYVASQSGHVIVLE